MRKTGTPRASKKTTKKEVPAKTPEEVRFLEGPEVREGFLYFSKHDLLRYELAQTKMRAATREMELIQHAERNLVLEFEAKRAQLKASGRELSNAAAEAGRNLNELQREVELLYQVSVGDIMYDDETGKISTKDGPVQA